MKNLLNNLFYWLATFNVVLVLIAETHEKRIENLLLTIVDLLFALYWQNEDR